MSSSYSPNLSLELIGTGDQAGTWGITTNTNLGTLLEQAISGYVTQAVSTGADTTITIPNGADGVARNMYIELTGTGGADTNLIVPANKKLYFIFNNTASGQVTVKVTGQTGVSVPNKAKMILVSNGTDIVDATNYVGNLSAASATITNLSSSSATITNLIATTASVSDLSATVTRSASATITNLLATSLTVSSGSRLDGGVVINEPGADVDFRVEGDTDANLIFADASTDRVGLGISSPAEKLHLFGSSTATSPRILVQSHDTANATAGLLLYGRNASNVNFVSEIATSGQDLIFKTNNTTKATLDSSGNLGLGVTPSAWNSSYKAFEFGSGSLMGRSTNTDIYMLSNSFLDASGNFVYKSSAAAGYYAQGLGQHQWFNAPSGTAGNTITFTQAMTLNASGTLLVGLTDSSNFAKTCTTSLGVYENNDAADGGVFITKQSGSPNRLGSIRSFGQDSGLTFWTNSGGTTTERARITSGGDFCIGITSASGKLHVNSTTAGSHVKISGAVQQGLEFRSSTNTPGILIGRAYTSGNTNDFFIYDDVNAAIRVFINTSGEVCIGSNADQGPYNLQCNFTGVWGAGAYVNGSDARIKEDVAPIASGLDVVEKLNPVTYRYKESWSKDQSVQTGFIAQELLTALDGQVYVDGVVQQGGAEGYYSVAYQNIIPLLTKAIQELKAELDATKAEVAALKGT